MRCVKITGTPTLFFTCHGTLHRTPTTSLKPVTQPLQYLSNMNFGYTIRMNGTRDKFHCCQFHQSSVLTKCFLNPMVAFTETFSRTSITSLFKTNDHNGCCTALVFKIV